MIAVSHSLEENASQRRRYSYDSERNINKRADYDEGIELATTLGVT